MFIELPTVLIREDGTHPYMTLSMQPVIQLMEENNSRGFQLVSVRIISSVPTDMDQRWNIMLHGQQVGPVSGQGGAHDLMYWHERLFNAVFISDTEYSIFHCERRVFPHTPYLEAVLYAYNDRPGGYKQMDYENIQVILEVLPTNEMHPNRYYNYIPRDAHFVWFKSHRRVAGQGFVVICKEGVYDVPEVLQSITSSHQIYASDKITSKGNLCVLCFVQDDIKNASLEWGYESPIEYIVVSYIDTWQTEQ